MNRKSKSGNRSGAKAGGLAFKRETIRTLSAAETKLIAGGMPCQTSCHGETCPASVCTITIDKTI
ncbi:MAG TPA: hypothetical protein VHT91_06030 [Kofleriaceae bacterium]|jgi:hypothetical protein|nr:hypothetical protein [Kofleriaceae bacterium]